MTDPLDDLIAELKRAIEVSQEDWSDARDDLRPYEYAAKVGGMKGHVERALELAEKVREGQ